MTTAFTPRLKLRGLGIEKMNKFGHSSCLLWHLVEHTSTLAWIMSLKLFMQCREDEAHIQSGNWTLGNKALSCLILLYSGIVTVVNLFYNSAHKHQYKLYSTENKNKRHIILVHFEQASLLISACINQSRISISQGRNHTISFPLKKVGCSCLSGWITQR